MLKKIRLSMVSRVEVIPGKHEHVSMLLLATTEHIWCVV